MDKQELEIMIKVAKELGLNLFAIGIDETVTKEDIIAKLKSLEVPFSDDTLGIQPRLFGTSSEGERVIVENGNIYAGESEAVLGVCDKYGFNLNGF